MTDARTAAVDVLEAAEQRVSAATAALNRAHRLVSMYANYLADEERHKTTAPTP